MRSFLPSSLMGNDLKGKIPEKVERSVLSKMLAPNDDDQDFDYVSIKNAATISRILNQIHFANSKINLHYELNGEQFTYYTTIAKVNQKARQIVIHQPKPSSWQDVITPGEPIEVSCFMPNGQISFFSKLELVDEKRDNYYCLMKLPKEMSKYQLRSAFRVFMPPGSCNVELVSSDSNGERTLFEGVGLDLSTEGCCLRFIGDPYALTNDDKTLHNLDFNIMSGRIRFKADAEIRRTATVQGGQMVAGVKFHTLPPNVIKRLQSALIEIQRIQLRQQVQVY